LGLTTRSIL